ncbi:MAG TPA: Gldg family protein, partial [Anaeromyxobacteraceae bacterium]
MSKHILSRVVGAIGAVLVSTSAVTLFFGNARFLAGKLLLGLACIAISFAFGEAGGLRRFFAGRALHFGAVTAVSVVALLAVLATANYLATKRPRSWDLTKNRIYTLQPDTLRTLDGLEQDVRAVAVYRMDEEGWAQAEALLRRYAARSPRFHYELVDPYKSPEKARTFGVLAGGPRILLIAGEQ